MQNFPSELPLIKPDDIKDVAVVRWPTREILQMKRNAANKKDALQTKNERCKQKRLCKQKRTLQAKKMRCKQKKADALETRKGTTLLVVT